MISEWISSVCIGSLCRVCIGINYTLHGLATTKCGKWSEGVWKLSEATVFVLLVVCISSKDVVMFRIGYNLVLKIYSISCCVFTEGQEVVVGEYDANAGVLKLMNHLIRFQGRWIFIFYSSAHLRMLCAIIPIAPWRTAPSVKTEKRAQMEKSRARMEKNKPSSVCIF